MGNAILSRMNLKERFEQSDTCRFYLCLYQMTEFSEYIFLTQGLGAARFQPAAEQLGVNRVNPLYAHFLSFCNGGELFTTSVLGVNRTSDSDIVRYNRLATTRLNLPRSHYIIAYENYGAQVCLAKDGTDHRVFLWDVAHQRLECHWSDLADWLSEEIDNGRRLIEDGLLSPIAGTELEDDLKLQ